MEQFMPDHQSNPLAGYFRQPAIYLKLPSQGRWWPQGSLELPQNGEIGIMPMSTKDEIIIKTPDALLNGQGVVDVIQSCCSNIKDAWAMPSVDVDAVIIAIRIATYGNKMTVNSKCPKCNSANEHEVELGAVLENINCPDFDTPVQYRDLGIQLRPRPYFEVNKTNMLAFEQQKILEVLNVSGLEKSEQAEQISKIVEKIVESGIEGIAAGTEYIELPNGDRVSNRQHIKEFYNNAENEVIRSIQSKNTDLIESSKPKDFNAECSECQHQYKVAIEFDYSSFFDQGF